MNTTRWAAALILVLVAAGPARANVAVPLFKSDPNYQRAQVAGRIALPVIFISVPVVLFLCFLPKRSSGVRRGGCAFGLAGLFALYSVAMNIPDLVMVTEEPQPNGLRYSREPGDGESPLTPAEFAIWLLIVSGVVIFGGLGLARLVARQFRQADVASGTTDQKTG